MSANQRRAVMIVAIYLRISPKPEENKEVLAIERQESECRAKAKQLQLDREHGWEIRLYVDQSVSATSKKKRPEYGRMLEDMKAGHVQAVIVLDQDRLVRKPMELEEFLDTAEDMGIRLATVGGERDLANPEDRMFLRQVGTYAKYEMEKKVQRQKRMHRQRRENGNGWAHNRPYGFLADGETHHPTEASVVREMFRDFISGVTQSGIADGLNRAGHVTSFGNQWRQSSVRQLLLNPRYAGLCGYMDEKSRVWEVIGPAGWDGIVSEEDWRAVTTVINANLKGRGSKSRAHLLSSLAICGLCDGRLTVNYASRAQNPNHRYYKCRSCGRIARSAVEVELLVERTIVRRLSAPDAEDLLGDPSKPEVVDLRGEANTLRKRLDQFARERAMGELSDTEWKVMRDIAMARLNEIEEAMSHTVRSPLLAELVNGDAVKIWSKMSVDKKRVVIQDLLRVVVLPVSRLGSREFNEDDIRLEWVTR